VSTDWPFRVPGGLRVRPDRCTLAAAAPGQDQPSGEQAAPETSLFVRRLAVRPAEWLIAEDPGWERAPIRSALTGNRAAANAVRRAFHIGVVREYIGEDGTALCTLWEVPSGRSLLVELLPKYLLPSRAGEAARKQVPGAQVRVWSWVRLKGGKEVQERRWAATLPSELSRAKLKRLVNALSPMEHEEEEEPPAGALVSPAQEAAHQSAHERPHTADRAPPQIDVLPPGQPIRAEHLPDGKLSVAIFGPGEGESIVVRLPDGRVGVVDGCAQAHYDPVQALLNALEVKQLAFVALTHPHEDHYRGLAELIARFEPMELWKPPASARSLNALLAVAPELPALAKGQDKSQLQGFLKALQAHRKLRRVRRLGAQTELLRADVLKHPLRVVACGPAENDTDQADEDIYKAMLAINAKEKVGRGMDPNRASGAILVEWGEARVLLAGDLCGSQGVAHGWSWLTDQLRARVQVVSVAHHASEAAHHEAIWDQMAPQIAIVTPFMHAQSKQPPRRDMLATLRDDPGGCAVVVTARPAWAKTAEPSGSPEAAGLLPTRVPASRNGALSEACAANASGEHGCAVALNADGSIHSAVRTFDSWMM
jgi:beta-lactamase superfamily II metal-dependent hydrolase